MSNSSNIGTAASVLDFQGGGLHPTSSFTVAQSITIESAGANIQVDPGISLTLRAPVTAGGNLHLFGGGTLALATGVAYSGNIFVNLVDSTTLAIADDVSLSGPNVTVVFNGAILTAKAQSTFTTYTVPGHLVISGPTTFDIPASTNLTTTGVIDNTGSLTKIGAGRLMLSGNNDFTGGATVAEGILQVTSDSPSFITTLGATSFGAAAPQTVFADAATAHGATITTNGGNAVFQAGGLTVFQDTSTLDNAIIVTNGSTGDGAGGLTEIVAEATGGSTKIVTTGSAAGGSGVFDISQSLLPGLTVGSIEGSGNYRLGSKVLTFGSLNTNTSLSGVISDSGIGGGSGGSIVKVGNGTTTLAGLNTYTGTTTVDAGSTHRQRIDRQQQPGDRQWRRNIEFRRQRQCRRCSHNRRRRCCAD